MIKKNKRNKITFLNKYKEIVYDKPPKIFIFIYMTYVNFHNKALILKIKQQNNQKYCKKLKILCWKIKN